VICVTYRSVASTSVVDQRLIPKARVLVPGRVRLERLKSDSCVIAAKVIIQRAAAGRSVAGASAVKPQSVVASGRIRVPARVQSERISAGGRVVTCGIKTKSTCANGGIDRVRQWAKRKTAKSKPWL
jgi:hypothetical protein